MRAQIPGGSFFFTAALLERRRRLLTDHIDALRESHVGWANVFSFAHAV